MTPTERAEWRQRLVDATIAQLRRTAALHQPNAYGECAYCTRVGLRPGGFPCGPLETIRDQIVKLGGRPDDE